MVIMIKPQPAVKAEPTSIDVTIVNISVSPKMPPIEVAFDSVNAACDFIAKCNDDPKFLQELFKIFSDR